jgi:phosphohistidine phosphatase
MKTLYLLRHAKSSWKDPGLDDLDRPLNKRGRETAKTMAAYIRRAKIAPDLVLCSTAVRAKQTLEHIAKAIKPPRVAFESRIYGVAQPELLKYLRGLPETVECALMIGHNPGLHDLALALADTKSRKRLPPAEGKFPTGAIAAFRFEGAWKGIALEWRDRVVIHRPKGNSFQIAPSFTVRSYRAFGCSGLRRPSGT